jgi:hypothetical protein
VIGQQSDFVWAKQFSGTGMLPNIESATSAIDHEGNAYSSGMFKGTFDFDPGPGIYNLTPSTWRSNTACIYSGLPALAT